MIELQKENELQKEIHNTRVGGFGSSDAKMIAQVGATGEINETMKFRIAQMLGIEPIPTFSNWFTENGNMREKQIFDYVSEHLDLGSEIKSNPYNKYDADFPFNVINHIDIEIDDGVSIEWYEVKTSKFGITETYNNYKEQIAWHYMILEQKAIAQNKDFALYLKLYRENYDEYSKDFNSANLTQVKITPELCSDLVRIILNIRDGLALIAFNLPTIKETYKKKEIMEDDMLTVEDEIFFFSSYNNF